MVMVETTRFVPRSRQKLVLSEICSLKLWVTNKRKNAKLCKVIGK